MSPPGGGRVRKHAWISGRVQGVFFRESAREEAEKVGVTGWVKNLPDGRVEAVFEGPRERVDAMIDWCRQGPPSARVTSVDAREEPVRGEESFRALRS